jgi:ATP-dependent RNA helicase RhlE
VAQTKNWEDLGLNAQLLKAIADSGFGVPTEVQVKCIPLVIGGQQVIGIAQTGTGKTAAYLLPILMKIKFMQGVDPRALILVPTRELAIQVSAHARQLAKYTDLRIIGIYGGVSPQAQIEEIKAGIDILVATPGRFMEIYHKRELAPKQIKVLVLDEADRMMDMGFMPQIRKIQEVIPQKRQNLLFSATFHPRVESLSREFLEFPIKIEVTPQSTPAGMVEQEAYHLPNLRTKINMIEYLLRDTTQFTRVMIFARTKGNADNVFKFIERKNLGPARVIHANKGQNARINAVSEFRDGKVRVLVATDVASRGIDVSNVSHVINFDVPVMYDDYVHRIGRTGRALQHGKAITLVSPAETWHITHIEQLIRGKIPVKAKPKEVGVEETMLEEQEEMARAIDNQKKKDDPEFGGAFHERKGKAK